MARSCSTSTAVCRCLLVSILSGAAALTNVEQLRAQVLAFDGAPTASIECRTVIHSTYEGRNVDSSYQEPERMLSQADWERLRKPLSGVYSDNHLLNETVRVHSLNRVFHAMPQFFNTNFPDLRWCLTSGSLLAVARTGQIMPWDLDGDTTVDMTVFDTPETIEKLKSAYGEPMLINGTFCHFHALPGGVCYGWDIGQDIVFTTFPLPLSDHMRISMKWFARFIDLRTGYFVDILKAKQVESTAQALLGDTLLPVPKVPSMMEYLNWEYENDTAFYLARMPSEMFDCSCSADHFKDLDVAPSSFEMTVSRACGAADTVPWDISEVDVTAACCRKVAERTEPLTEEELIQREEPTGTHVPLIVTIKTRAITNFASKM